MNHGTSVGGTHFRSLEKTNRLVNHQLKMGGFWQKIMENLQISIFVPGYLYSRLHLCFFCCQEPIDEVLFSSIIEACIRYSAIRAAMDTNPVING